MGWTTSLGQTGFSLAVIALAMALISLLEVASPLHSRESRHRAHLVPNLTLSALTLATSALLNVALVLALAWLEARQAGLLRWAGLAPWTSALLGFVALDLAFYLAHVAMHKVPALWRVHKVHHADPVVDVTTSFRHHPLEGVIRYAFTSVFACTLGVGLGAFAVYRSVSALNGLLEHANLRVPDWLDRALSWITTWPDTHKIHHARERRYTDSNYGNIFSWFDRAFGTFTPSSLGKTVRCGLEGMDGASTQTVGGLLALPFRAEAAAGAAGSLLARAPARSP